jgi:hypothetical protein
MTPINFPQANKMFGPPPDLDGSQCGTLPAFIGQVVGGNLDGSPFVVVAWQPDAWEIAAIAKGAPLFLSVLGGLPPHFISTDFKTASYQS